MIDLNCEEYNHIIQYDTSDIIIPILSKGGNYTLMYPLEGLTIRDGMGVAIFKANNVELHDKAFIIVVIALNNKFQLTFNIDPGEHVIRVPKIARALGFL